MIRGKERQKKFSQEVAKQNRKTTLLEKKMIKIPWTRHENTEFRDSDSHRKTQGKQEERKN